MELFYTDCSDVNNVYFIPNITKQYMHAYNISNDTIQTNKQHVIICEWNSLKQENKYVYQINLRMLWYVSTNYRYTDGHNCHIFCIPSSQMKYFIFCLPWRWRLKLTRINPGEKYLKSERISSL